MNSIHAKASDNLRILIAAMVEQARSGHPGGAMGGADFIHILYSEFLRFSPDDTGWHLRDRLFLDPGHMSAMMYAELSMFGYYSMDDLRSFRQWGSPTPGHPEVDIKRGIENTSGPLGQGHAMAVGAAIAERFHATRFGEWMAHKIYTYISDGGIQEEVSQGAGRIAGHLGLNNLIMFYDSNDIQLSTTTSAVTSEDTAAKYESWGWKVVTIKGNDHDEIRKALKMANEEKEKPFLIIGKTRMGKGIRKNGGESFENQVSTHGQPVTSAGASFEQTVLHLGGDPMNPFIIFPEVAVFYKTVKEQKQQEADHRKKMQKDWEKANPELAGKLKKVLSHEPVNLVPELVTYGANQATRSVSASVLTWLSANTDNIIVMSADLANSDKTEGFLKNKKPFIRKDFSGGFLHAGVSELTMAALANGMALHDVLPVCGTFFVFSDYMKPAFRLAALMQLQVIYVWTHDSFMVGEDGPTHQPVEHEAQLRLMEQLKNHDGKNSVMALRPADGAETIIAWKMALENTSSPTALILTRQNTPDLPAREGSSRMIDAAAIGKGAYIVHEPEGKPDIILAASGSDVSLLMDTAKTLQDKHSIMARVLSVASPALFLQQTKSYRKSVLTDGIPVFGLSTGLPAVMEHFLQFRGKVFGLDHFGHSAPAGVLMEQFGFTSDNICSEILNSGAIRIG